jgi:cystathionine gamma-synthase
LHAGGPYGYGREHNDTLAALESVLGELEGGTAVTFSSGMAAANSVFDLFNSGDVVVASRYSYGGVMARLKELDARGVISLRLVDVTEQADVDAHARNAQWVWVESPTNPMLEVCDLRATAEVAHSVGAKLVVDNTFMTPLRQKPLALGADIVMHSVTKSLAGHSDLLMGAIVTKDEHVAEQVLGKRVSMGGIPSAFDGYLALRGIRTLHVRLDRAEHNAMILAERLADHPAISVVHYPGLPSHKNAGIHKDQASGPGTVLSFEVGAGADAAQRVTESVKLMTYATSLGGVETLIERRRRWAGENPLVPENLVRLSVGIEYVEDLWKDLEQALK